MRFWKWVGLAGLVGVAAVGIAAGTSTLQRQRRVFVDAPPHALRDRLHARLREAEQRRARLADSHRASTCAPDNVQQPSS